MLPVDTGVVPVPDTPGVVPKGGNESSTCFDIDRDLTRCKTFSGYYWSCS